MDLSLLPISLTFGRHCSYHTITGRLQILTRASRQTFWDNWQMRYSAPAVLSGRHWEKTRDPILVLVSESKKSTSQRYWEIGLR